MVKPTATERPSERGDSKYKGVRKRKWGKWVSEIRLPNSRERIWLGSYDSPEKAARAFDAALFCLRGNTATFNFPDSPPDIPGAALLNPAEIQAAAANYANSGGGTSHRLTSHSDNSSSSSSTTELQPESPSHSVSESIARVDSERTIDTSFLDHFATMGSDHIQNSLPDYEIFPGFDDITNQFSNEFYMPPTLPTTDYAEENCDGSFTQEPSFLWNF